MSHRNVPKKNFFLLPKIVGTEVPKKGLPKIEKRAENTKRLLQ